MPPRARFAASPCPAEPLAFQFLREGGINKQSGCLLLLKLPLELFLHIADLSMTPSAGESTKLAKQDTALARTCKLVYIEVFKIPFQQKSIAVSPTPSNPRYEPNINKLKTWQFSLLTSVELHFDKVKFRPDKTMLHDHDLFDTALKELRVDDRHRHIRLDPLRNFPSRRAPNKLTPDKYHPFPVRQIKNLILVVARHAWNTAAEDPEHQPLPYHLALDPGLDRSFVQAQHMQSFSLRRLAGQSPRDGPPYPKLWSEQVSEFPDLRSLEFKFEAYAQKRDQLERVVDCAKTWRFPMGDAHELRWDGDVDAYARLSVETSQDGMPWLERVQDGRHIRVETRVMRWKKVPLESAVPVEIEEHLQELVAKGVFNSGQWGD